MSPTITTREENDKHPQRTFDDPVMTLARVTVALEYLRKSDDQTYHVIAQTLETTHDELVSTRKAAVMARRMTPPMQALRRIMQGWSWPAWLLWKLITPVGADRMLVEGTVGIIPFLRFDDLIIPVLKREDVT